MIPNCRSSLCLLHAVALAACLLAAGARAEVTQGTPADSSMALKAGETGTAFESLTIEGEDKIHIEFERPELAIALDPLSVGGLEGEGMEQMLARTQPDLFTPLLTESAHQGSRFLARPWYAALASGGLVKFRPELEGVKRWSLLIADSRGDTMIVISGDKKLPEQIEWDGRTISGEAALPGLTYSYVLTAWDKAGNKRNFVGEGFELPPYRLESKDSRMMLFSAAELKPTGSSSAEPDVDPPLLCEVASRLNQAASADETIKIVVKARSYEQASRIGQQVAGSLQRRLLGDPARIQTLTEVESQAPEEGAVIVLAEKS